MSRSSVQTIQKTGKLHKAVQALSMLGLIGVIVYGVVRGTAATEDELPSIIAGCSIAFFVLGVVYIAARISAWWCHG